MTAQNEILDWATTDFGDSKDNDALEAVMNSIRWSAHPTPVEMVFYGLSQGGQYKLQLLFHEQCCTRGFDVLVDGVEIVGEFSPQREHGGIAAAGTGAVITYDYHATSFMTNMSSTL